MRSVLEAYLIRLGLELRRRGLFDARIVEEARGHLTDSAEQGIQRGLSSDAAEREAISRFGSPETIAGNFATERYRLVNWLLFIFALIVGLTIAYVDSRPWWDDAGVTAFSLLVSAGVFGLVGPQRPWLWALAIGIWIPLHAIARNLSLGSLGMLVVLAFPFAGAYAGMAIRRVLATGVPTGHNRLEFHDKPGPRFHFAVKSKRGWVNPEFLAIASDPNTQLVPFLERVAPAPLGPLGQVQSVTLVEAESTKDAKKYRVVFGRDVKTVCTITLAPNGQGVAMDWSREVPPG